MAVNRNKLLGLEFDFAMTDGDGHVALFATAGFGPVPNAGLTTNDPPDIEQLFLSDLPEIGSASSEGRGPGNCAEWPALGRRGVFVYDWRGRSGPYERVIVPENAIRLEALTESTQSVLAGPIAGCFRHRDAVNPVEIGA